MLFSCVCCPLLSQHTCARVCAHGHCQLEVRLRTRTCVCTVSITVVVAITLVTITVIVLFRSNFGSRQRFPSWPFSARGNLCLGPKPLPSPLGSAGGLRFTYLLPSFMLVPRRCRSAQPSWWVPAARGALRVVATLPRPLLLRQPAQGGHGLPPCWRGRLLQPFYFDLFLFALNLHTEVHNYPIAARPAQKTKRTKKELKQNQPSSVQSHEERAPCTDGSSRLDK